MKSIFSFIRIGFHILIYESIGVEKDRELANLREQIEKLLKTYDMEAEGKRELTEKQKMENLALKQQYLAKNEECKKLNNKLQEAKVCNEISMLYNGHINWISVKYISLTIMLSLFRII